LEINKIVSISKFLVLGGAGTIGQAFTKEVFKRNPEKIHVVDINENNLAELVRDIRSSYGYIKGDFHTYTLDIGSNEFKKFFQNDGEYDYILNFTALKHVRSEKDPYTLMRMIDVNVMNTITTIDLSELTGVKKYFCVSTDKACNPINLMGASKRIMELFLFKKRKETSTSSARFANVAFSDGSLLDSFKNRFKKRQPIVAPTNIKRYFITSKESAELCLLSCLFAKNNEIFYPKQNDNLQPILFTDLAIDFLKDLGFDHVNYNSEDEARNNVKKLLSKKKWPCYFSPSDTSGEKEVERFYNSDDILILNRFKNIGIIKNNYSDNFKLNTFLDKIDNIKSKDQWSKFEIVKTFKDLLSHFDHREKQKNLDDKM
jgi:FlaA1/EpsC-like NDP-sugar epimerase